MRLLIVIAAISLLYRCSDKIVTNPYKGIKSVNTIIKSMKSQKGLEESLAEKTIYEEFDINGNAIFLKADSYRGIEKLKRKFNNEGQLIETFSEKYVGVYHHHKYYYDNEGQKKLEIWYDEDKNVIYEWKLEKDIDSLMIREYMIEEVNDTILRSVTSLNKKFKPLTRSYYDREGLLTAYDEFNKNGLRERMLSFDKNGIIDFEYIIFYNKRREMVRQVKKFKRSKGLKEIESLYKKGKLIKKTSTSINDKSKSILTRTYDKHGNILSELKRSNKEKEDYSIRFEYVYDLKGNWIKKKKYRNDELLIETERIIKYY